MTDEQPGYASCTHRRWMLRAAAREQVLPSARQHNLRHVNVSFHHCKVLGEDALMPRIIHLLKIVWFFIRHFS
jgi:hypothetical protein